MNIITQTNTWQVQNFIYLMNKYYSIRITVLKPWSLGFFIFTIHYFYALIHTKLLYILYLSPVLHH